MANITLNNSPHRLYSAEHVIFLVFSLVSTDNQEISVKKTKSYIEFWYKFWTSEKLWQFCPSMVSRAVSLNITNHNVRDICSHLVFSRGERCYHKYCDLLAHSNASVGRYLRTSSELPKLCNRLNITTTVQHACNDHIGSDNFDHYICLINTSVG